MKRKAYSRVERQSMILDEFYKLVDSGIMPEMTIYKLAKLIDMTPSPHLRSIVWDMVHDGLLDSRTQYHRPNAFRTVFFIPPDRYSFPKKTERMIRFNGGKLSF